MHNRWMTALGVLEEYPCGVGRVLSELCFVHAVNGGM